MSIEKSTISWDLFGHCCLCHKDMLITQIIEGKEEQRFTPDYAEVEYILNDKSKMRVAMCKDCKSTLTDSQSKTIMDCVIKGWQVEVDKLPWAEEKKKNHMNKYSKLKILKQHKEKK